MPMQRTDGTPAVNPRISQAQKDRTRLACSTCRARRIKCDGRAITCGRCLRDNRPDCHYEDVGTMMRMAGRQRKKMQRLQHSKEDRMASSSNPALHSPPNLLDDHLDWTTALLASEQPFTRPHSLTTAYQQQQWQPIQAEHHQHSLTTTPRIENGSFSDTSTPSLHSITSSRSVTSSNSVASSLEGPSQFALWTSKSQSHPYSPDLSSDTWHSNIPTSSDLTSSDGAFVTCHLQTPLHHSLSYNYASDSATTPSDALWRVRDWKYQGHPVHPSIHPPAAEVTPATPAAQQWPSSNDSQC